MRNEVAVLLILVVGAFAVPVAAQLGRSATGDMRDATSLRTEPYLALPAATTQLDNMAQRILFSDVHNDFVLVATNPRDDAYDGTFTLRGNMFQGPGVEAAALPFNRTTGSLDIPAHGAVEIALQAYPINTGGHLSFEATLDGTAGTWTGTARTQFDFEVRPAVSVHIVAPVPRAGLATSSSFFGGMRDDTPVVPVGVHQQVTIQARVDNMGPTPANLRLRITGFDQNTVGPDVNITALAPGTSTTVTMARITPISLNSRLADGQGQRDFSFQVVELRLDPGGQEQQSATLGFRLLGGVVTDLSMAAVRLSVDVDLTPVLEAPAYAVLGRPVLIVLNVTNHGARAVSGAAMTVVFSPPFHALYSVQTAQSHSFKVSVQPGATHLERLELTPLVAGRWDLGVRCLASACQQYRSVDFTIDVPTRADIKIVGSVKERVALGETATTRLELRSLDAFPQATLRVATGAASGGQSDGGGGPLPGESTVGGLSAGVVRAVPDEVDLGDLGAGNSRTFDVTIEGRASGTYYVVPYVVAGGRAYTGGVFGPADGIETDPTLAAFQLTVLPRDVPAMAALAPALATLVLCLGIIVGRRLIVK